MPALVMTRARSFMRAPQLWQCSTSILKLLIRSSRHGRYPERWVGGWSFAVRHRGRESHQKRQRVEVEGEGAIAQGESTK
jgi:hypothetical protein